MQRTWVIRLKIALQIALPIVVIGLCILFDQLTKSYFKNNFIRGKREFVIEDFFYFTYTVNTGAAWSFLAGKSWAQTFFKVLTSIALVAFVIYIAYAIKRKQKWLTYSLSLIIGGTIGNFIDRLAFNGVTDWIGFLFWGNAFPVFNLADSFLVVGLILLIIYYAFFDDNALFKKKSKNDDNNQCISETEVGLSELTQDLSDKVEDGNEDISGN